MLPPVYYEPSLDILLTLAAVLFLLWRLPKLAGRKETDALLVSAGIGASRRNCHWLDLTYSRTNRKTTGLPHKGSIATSPILCPTSFLENPWRQLQEIATVVFMRTKTQEALKKAIVYLSKEGTGDPGLAYDALSRLVVEKKMAEEADDPIGAGGVTEKLRCRRLSRCRRRFSCGDGSGPYLNDLRA